MRFFTFFLKSSPAIDPKLKVTKIVFAHIKFFRIREWRKRIWFL